jgi:hypothetical protein
MNVYCFHPFLLLYFLRSRLRTYPLILSPDTSRINIPPTLKIGAAEVSVRISDIIASDYWWRVNGKKQWCGLYSDSAQNLSIILVVVFKD